MGSQRDCKWILTITAVCTDMHRPYLNAVGAVLPTAEIVFDKYCDHAVRFGVVESINTTIKAVLRRARGMRDEEMLLYSNR